MKFALLTLVLVSGFAFAEDATKKVVTETTTTTESTDAAAKKPCPMVNGKEDCTVQEVKTKSVETKKKSH